MSQEGPLDPGIGEEGAGGMVAGCCGGVEAILAPNALGAFKTAMEMDEARGKNCLEH